MPVAPRDSAGGAAPGAADAAGLSSGSPGTFSSTVPRCALAVEDSAGALVMQSGKLSLVASCEENQEEERQGSLLVLEDGYELPDELLSGCETSSPSATSAFSAAPSTIPATEFAAPPAPSSGAASPLKDYQVALAGRIE